jgi:hypothetical protein
MKRQEYLESLPQPIAELARLRMGKKANNDEKAKRSPWYDFIMSFEWPDDEYNLWASVCQGKDLVPFYPFVKERIAKEHRRRKTIIYKLTNIFN